MSAFCNFANMTTTRTTSAAATNTKTAAVTRATSAAMLGFKKINCFRETIQEPGYLDSNQFVCLRSLSLCAAIRCGQSFCKINRRKNAKYHFWKVKVQDIRREHVICNYID